MAVNSDDLDRFAAAVGQRVRAMRSARGWTQQLAAAAGISRNQVQNVELNRNNTAAPDGGVGRGNPTLETLYRLADAFGVRPGDLIP